MSIPKRKVRRVEFGVMSPDQIESYGVCEITEPTTVKGKEGGLYDLRMGPTSHGDLCKTCGQNMDTCPGHFGYIKLNARVVHYGFIEYIYKVLQIVCWNCRKLLARPSAKDLEEEKPSALERAAQLERLKRTRKGPLRLGALKMLQSKTCPHCGEVVSSFKRTEGVRFERFFKENMDGYNAADVEEAGAGGRRSRGQQQQQQQRMQDKKEMLTGDKIWNVFKDLSREDVELMGFDWERSHPKNMLISVFPVSPPAVRPSVDNGGQSASNDDLTNILKKVIIINNDIAEKNVGQEKQQSIDTLTAYITAYINNDLPSKRPLTSTSGRPYKAISQRLKGKEGRVRGNLMGKRVDFSGRTVITPDPNLDIDEVGVPVSIAITLTVPEYVNALNIRKLERLIEAGPDKYPGAKSVTIVGLDGSETKYSLKTGRDFRAKIEPGRAIVERHLMTGDIVVFNRQPSLHKMSMMGHRARVMPFSSFRLNLCVTTPYNADFDGDEMNLHVPQDLAARAEVRELMMVPKNIVAPASNRPVMGIVQDSLLGSMLMTQPSTFVDKDSVFNTLSWLNEWDWKVPYPAIIKAPGKPTITSSGTGTGGSSRSSGLSISNSGVNGDNNSDDDDDDNNNNNGDDDYNNSDTEAAAAMDIEGDGGNGMLRRRRRRRRTTRRGAGAGAGTGKGGPLWTGKQLFSKVMPDISLTRGDLGGDIRKGRDKGFKFQENTVVISHGELLCGVIKKNLIGPSSSGGITHTIWKELGPESAKIFLGQTQKVVNSWLLQRGFSIGICDNIPDEETKKDVKLVLDKAFLEVEKQITAFRNGSTQIEPGFTMQQSFEINVNKTLNDARKKAGDNANKRIDHRNSIKCTVDSGSKGNAINISQILACVGQQNVEGKRIPFGFVNRTLPHFAQYDEGHLSRGFVVHSYLAGLTPQEFFFHAMGGREGLSDTAVKTSETGYTQRRLMKSMEDMQCKYDGTVRDTTGTVLQFLYGEDSFDATYMEKYEPFLIGAADEDVEARYRFTTEELAQPGPATGITPEVADLIEGDPTTRAKLEQEYAALQNVRSFYRGVYTNPDDPSTSDQGDPNLMTEIAVPCNVRRCIAVVAARHGINSLSMPEGLTPTAIVDDVEALLAELEALLPSPSKEAKHNALTLFSCVIRELLAAKPVLCHHRLSRVAWRDVLSAVKERFVQAIVAPGESVGPLAAQSIGEPATQMTLNTFHYAGVSEKNVTLGVPRLKELIDVAKTIKTPLLTITLAEDKNDSEYAKEVLGSIEHTSVRDVVTTSAIYFDPYSEVPSKAGDVEPANAYYETHPDCEFALHHDNISPWVLCYKLNEPVLNLKKLTARDVVNKILEVAADNPPYVFSIKSRFGTYVYVRIVLSDDMKVSKDAWYSNEENEDDDDYINNNNNDNDDSGGGSAYGHRRNEARTSISTEDGDDDDDGGGGGSGGEKATPWDRAEVAVLVKANTAILESKLSGIDGIDSASIKEVIKVRLVPKEGMHDTEKAGAFFKPSMDDKEKYSKESVRRILASGTNFAQLLTHPMVNFARTSSNDVLTVYDVLGIEGARSTLLYELRKVLSFDNSYVNDRHIGILADTMTQTGRLVAVSRHGINRSGTSGPLMRASFEETAAQFMQAAAFAETDYLKGISGNIMLGQLAPLGTGSICVVLDIDKLKDALAHDVVVAPAGGSGGGSGGGGGGSSNGSGDDYDYAAAAAAMSGMDRWDAINDPTKFSPTYFTSPTDAAGSFSPMGPLESSPAVGFLAASSPIYAPSSPNSAGADYSPSSPMYSNGMSSPRYGVSSPRYGGSSNSNSSSGGNAAGSGVSSPTYSPSSPNYSPSSPRYSPSSPRYSPSSPKYAVSSPKYSPSSPNYSPSSPKYSPSSPRYSPSSPKYAVSSPKYSPSSPRYATTNGNGNNTVSSPKYSPGSPNVNGNNYYSPSSPGGDGAGYSPSSPAYGGSGSGSGGGGNYSPSSPSNF